MKKYKALIVDPPWDYGVQANNHVSMETLPARTRRGKKEPSMKRWPRGTPTGGIPKYLGTGEGAVTDGYDGVMDIKAIKEFTLIKELADDAALCFLWTTNRFLRDAYDVIESWGFKNPPLILIWDKGMGPQFPLSCAYSAEFVVVGRKGKFDGNMWLDTKAFNTCFHASPGKHSEKPASFYRLIRRVARGPRIDIFARRRHLGFDAWGNQVDPLTDGSDLFKKDFPETSVVQMETGELHYEDWEDWEKQKKSNQSDFEEFTD